ncbi:hypothetical protein FN846DRAFT_783259 [Sphaerosporella brunnea]|uniref:Nuclear segregation protein Bfr1 n=1 Tax=Sphaerosporella brunnea TaxID=1250544 RepID=A0A5J5EM70_9PEZI|nr:hypothetical protein FN846DRAFT_783259 [Sphaerosporella brunnea]
MATTSTASADVAASKKVLKPERPDEEAFKKAEAAAKKEYEAAQKDLSAIKAKLDSVKPGEKNPRQQELKDELAKVRAAVAAKKGSRQKTEDQIKALQDSINARVKDLNARRGNMPYRTLADLEAAIAKLDRDVSSGTMKIVEEKKALQEISNLHRQKKNFAAFEDAQNSIDADRAKLKEMKEKKQDPELKELNEKYEELDKEFKAIKAEQDSIYQNLNSLRDQRTALQAAQQEKWAALKKLQDDYYQARNAHRAYEREARKIREERRQKEQAEYHLAKKRAAAAEKLEAASQPAFASEIITCEGLIAFFDPSSAEAARKEKLAAAPRELAAKASREVKPIEGKKLVKEEEDYFVGTGGKKKKGKKSKSAPTEETAEAPAAAGKINLNVGLLEQLAQIDVPAPSSQAEVPQVLEKLREKLQNYKDNQDRVTKENIAKAQKEIDRLEKEGEEPAAENKEAEATEA